MESGSCRIADFPPNGKNVWRGGATGALVAHPAGGQGVEVGRVIGPGPFVAQAAVAGDNDDDIVGLEESAGHETVTGDVAPDAVGIAVDGAVGHCIKEPDVAHSDR